MELPRKHHTFKSAATRALFKNLIKQMAQNATIDPEWNDYFSSRAFLEDIDCPTAESDSASSSKDWSSSLDDDFLPHTAGLPDWRDEGNLSPTQDYFSRVPSFSASSLSEQEALDINHFETLGTKSDYQIQFPLARHSHSFQAQQGNPSEFNLSGLSFDYTGFETDQSVRLDSHDKQVMPSDIDYNTLCQSYSSPCDSFLTVLQSTDCNTSLPYTSPPSISRSSSDYPSTTQSEVSTAPSITTSSSRSELDSPLPDPAQVLQALDPATQRLCLEIAHKLLANSASTLTSLTGDQSSASTTTSVSVPSRSVATKNTHRRSGSTSGAPPLRRTMSDQARLDFMETKKRGACLECKRRKRKCNPSHVIRA